MQHRSQEKRTTAGKSADAPRTATFFPAIAALLRHPQRILFLWNWKSAWLSIILRGPIFLAATIRRGLGTTVLALITESVFCAVTAGFYGAIVQTLRNVEPEWLTILFLVVALPGLFQVLEALLHRLTGTPHLRVAEIVSILVTGVSSLFNWYAMRRGALLVGAEGSSFGSDVRRLPGLILAFLTTLPRYLADRKKQPGNTPKGAVRIGSRGT